MKWNNENTCYENTNDIPSLCPALRKILQQDAIYDNLRGILNQHKVVRDDVPEYTTKLLQRQQRVNEELIERWSDTIQWKNVLDACCWPEWSSLAVLKRGWTWRWNEITEKTYEHLKKLWLNVKNGNAENLPFIDKEFDYLIYCYAVNNIQATSRVFEESLRVLKEDGKILIADPWISRRVSGLILNAIKNDLPEHLLRLKETINSRKTFSETIPSYFEQKGISGEDYADVVLSGLCWFNRKTLIQETEKLLEQVQQRYPNNKVEKIKIDRLLYIFHQYINSCYRENIITAWRNNWAIFEKAAIFSCYQNIDEAERETTEKIELDIQHLNGYELRQYFTNMLKTPNDILKIGQKWIKKLLPTILFSFKKE